MAWPRIGPPRQQLHAVPPRAPAARFGGSPLTHDAPRLLPPHLWFDAASSVGVPLPRVVDRYARKWGKVMFAGVAIACIAAVIVVIVVRQNEVDKAHA